MAEKCYMCDGDATSREHVPPRAIFPEMKDAGEDFRKGLITVPSCDLHNSAKSRDDEFLMVSLAGIIGNNSIGYHHKLTKIDRAIRRSANRLLDSVFTKKETLQRIHYKDNQFFDVIWGTPDLARLTRCFEHVARGLHYEHFQRRFEGETRLVFGYFLREPGNGQTFAEFVRDRSEIELAASPKIGQNPEVFYFQVSDYDRFGLFMMKMCFYGGLNIYAAFIPYGTETPAQLGSMLMNAGIHTVMTLGDRKYEFNKPKRS